MSNEEKKNLLDFERQNAIILNLLKKDTENRWCVFAQFEIFEQIWDTVKDSLKISNVCISFVYLILHVPTCKISRKKKYMPAKLLAGAKLG